MNFFPAVRRSRTKNERAAREDLSGNIQSEGGGAWVGQPFVYGQSSFNFPEYLFVKESL